MLRSFTRLHRTINGVVKNNNSQGRKMSTKVDKPAASTTTTTSSNEKHLTLEKKDGVAIIWINSPNSKVNTLSRELMEEFRNTWKEFSNDNTLKSAVLISAKPGSFIAGADIKMFTLCETEQDAFQLSREGQLMMEEVARSEKPVVAAINGQCLGGGLELALACHYRIATNTSKTTLGLPEVQLGLLPGSGGSQRLPRLISLPDSLDMMLTGKNVRPPKAKKLNLVDVVVEPIGPGLRDSDSNTIHLLKEVAVDAAKQLADKKLQRSKARPAGSLFSIGGITNRLMALGPVKSFIFSQAAKTVKSKTGGHYPAPNAIIDVVQKGLNTGLEKGLVYEAEKFGELSQTNVSKSLISIFFNSTQLKKNRFGNPKQPAKSVAVLGAGLMGAGVVQVSAQRGFNTIMKDTNSNGLGRGEQQILKNLTSSVKKKQMTSFDRDILMSKIHSTLTYDQQFSKADIVIEAVFEDLKIKHKVLAEVESVVGPNTVFASNTSALPIGDIAAASKRPDKVIGMHYFSPVDKMPLLEIIKTPQTSQETCAIAVDVGLKQGKTVIVVNDGPGFYTTRILAPMLGEAFALLLEGCEFEQVDKALRQFGFPVGPLQLADEVGIDVGHHIAKYLGGVFKERMGNDDLRPLSEFVESGHLGRKSGKGFYNYEDAKSAKWWKPKGKQIHPTARYIINKYKKQSNQQKPISVEDMQFRMIGRFINEAVFCLEEGILANAVDGDMGAVFGLGWPPFSGGPFRFVDTYGAVNLVRKLEEYASQYGSHFAPAQTLINHARNNTKFHKQ